MENSCGKCKFFIGSDTPYKRLHTEAAPVMIGACRRFPPISLEFHIAAQPSAWPSVASNAWCGEYTEKAGKAAQ